MNTTTNPTNIKCICGANTKYRCGRCNKKYCSPKCQVEDWIKHKRICNTKETQYDLKKIEEICGECFGEDCTRILTTRFYLLNDADKNIYLDTKLKLLNGDLIVPRDICVMFDQLDAMNRFSDLLYITILHPRIISEHFEKTYDSTHYDIVHTWDWDLEKLTKMKKDQWRMDLVEISGLINGTKLGELIKAKVPEMTTQEKANFYAEGN